MWQALQRNRGDGQKNTLVNAVVCEEGKRVVYHVPQPGVAADAGAVAGIQTSLPERNKAWLPSTVQATCRSLGARLRAAAVSCVGYGQTTLLAAAWLEKASRVGPDFSVRLLANWCSAE